MLDGTKIKKRWLIALFLMAAWEWINFSAGILSNTMDTTGKIVLIFFGVPILLAIAGGIPYYCAYKKGGTKLLAFQMFFGSIRTLGNLSAEINTGANVQETLIGAAIMMPFLIFYLVKSYRLYQFNKLNKQQTRQVIDK